MFVWYLWFRAKKIEAHAARSNTKFNTRWTELFTSWKFPRSVLKLKYLIRFILLVFNVFLMNFFFPHSSSSSSSSFSFIVVVVFFGRSSSCNMKHLEMKETTIAERTETRRSCGSEWRECRRWAPDSRVKEESDESEMAIIINKEIDIPESIKSPAAKKIFFCLRF